MPPLVMKTFWPLITQSPFLRTARVFIDETSEPASGSVTAKAPTRRLLDGAEAGRDPGRDLLRRALGEDRGDRQPGALDGQRDAGAAPGQLLGDQRGHDARRVGVGLLEEVDPVEPDLGRLLDHRPRELLGLVVLDGDRADLLLGEVVDPVPDLTLLVAQLKRNHRRAPWLLCYNAFSTRYVPFLRRRRYAAAASSCQAA